MGVVYGIDIYHKNYSEDPNYYSDYEVFSLKQLEEVLEKAIKTTSYQLKRINRQRLLLQYFSVNQKENKIVKGDEQFTIENDFSKNKTILKALKLTPRLYNLIIKLSQTNRIKVKDNEIIPIYTLETISQYKGKGNYWLAYNRDSNGVKDDAIQIAKNFINYNEFWEFTVFIENFGCLYFNNHTDEPIDGFYNIVIKLVSTGEENNNHVTLEESENLLDKFFYNILGKKINKVSILFQPVYKSYENVKIKIEGKLDIEKLVKTYLEINIDQNKKLKSYDVKLLTNYSISVCDFYKKEEEDLGSLEINEAGLQKGLIYNKIYNKGVFNFLCTVITTNFCPCSPGGVNNKEEKIIYYKQAKDKEILQKLYSPFVTNLIFKKV
ncbi:hypothetical protein [Flavobacterium quisquiliarum]|uniref:Uncharacterized protein n=1 Tax=Flavobacterium quisquiliarum TaxID=1834436 RepID=A0ABV8W652_9FLAO|nr:hypothetical protein [Flavobacterium quisquiliarum]MBW1655377.1 hypothetical protein [Flavobacterium quisquiliarum]NWL03001.1 hypothetical protein [Flavobacterium collinsii]